MKIPWVFRMAWRDSRGSRTRLLVFVASLTLGVAALVSINSFGDNLRQAIDSQAASLLGADLEIERDTPFSDEQVEILDSIPATTSDQISFSSMALFGGGTETRLVSVRAVNGEYPYYGELETTPEAAAGSYLSKSGALIDGSLAAQVGAVVGDSMQIGTEVYRIEGILTKVPRETAIFSILSPRVYVPLERLDSKLLTFGSRAEYARFYLFDKSQDWAGWLDNIRADLESEDVRIATIESEKEGWSEVLTNVYRFLGLTALIALLLGSIGIASSVYVYIKQRRGTVALIRCLGSSNSAAGNVYLIQAVAMGVLGSVLGILLGFVVQIFVPAVVGDFVPVDVEFGISPWSIIQGLVTGVTVTTLFALIPLLDLRRISAMEAIRSASISSGGSGKFDPLKAALYATGFVAVSLFAILQAPTVLIGLVYIVGLVVVFGLLFITSKLILRVARWATRRVAVYTFKQSVANLQRPNNQTSLMMLSIGFGTFLIAAMFFVQNNLVNQIEVADQGNRPNTLFFDIQSDQVTRVSEMIESGGYPLTEVVPIVTMRIEKINGVTLDALEDSSDVTWAHSREYRSTYRNFLTDAESIDRGEFVPTYDASTMDLVPVSMENGLIGELDIDLGDRITFDVQGVPVDTYVSSIRTVDWQRVQTNFFFVFPEAVLEDAPKTFVAVTRVSSEEASGELQAQVVSAFPNISSIDLRLILSVFEEIFGRISFVLKFMAFFSMATGLVIVGGSVFVSRYYRIQESVLLRTLGASTRQLNSIVTGEYFVLGLLASTVGVALALISSALVSRYVFETDVSMPAGLSVLTIVIVVAVTLVVGLLNSRGISTRPPLEILRRESL
ncbi:MAG: FtsX-like permease family protein [Rhodothermales bacterium]|nr:FtsX-like permease family protein [Rhodothermales bacterium]